MSDWDDSDFEPDAPSVKKAPRRLMEEVQQFLIQDESTSSENESDEQIVLCKRYFPINYCNIVDEFADVEIFLISLDSLIVECLNHTYHNRNLGLGQSLVLCHQIDRFLEKLTSVGGKFKLVVFTDLTEIIMSDSHLDLAFTIVVEHITQGKFEKDLIYFMSPHDAAWDKFLRDMTPSFIMISMENPSFSASVRLATHFSTIMWNCLTTFLPVVLFNSLSINFKTVMAYRLSGNYYQFEEELDKRMKELWKNESVSLTSIKFPPTNVTTICDLWVNIIAQTKTGQMVSSDFDALASAILLSSLIGVKRGINRAYPPPMRVKKPSLTLNEDCEKLTRQAKMTLQLMDCERLLFSIMDFWDGRMILSLFEYIREKKPLLPTSLKEEFETYRIAAGVELIIPVDSNEKLHIKIRRKKVENPLQSELNMYSIRCTLLDSYVSEMKDYFKQFQKPQHSGYEQWFQKCSSWKFGDIPENFKPEYVVKTDWERTRENQQRQKTMRWYEMFATSLEGRGHLQVDFTRTASFASPTEEETTTPQKGWAGQKGNSGKKGKTTNKAKEIREANVRAKEQKIIEDEKLKINHALQQGNQTVPFLERLLDTLQTVESKALCALEMAKNEAARLIQEYEFTGNEKLEQKRKDCVELVGYIKECFVKQWEFLNEDQKIEVIDLWFHLGFKAPSGFETAKTDADKKLNLKMDLVYYLMEYGGQLVDIQSDPMKDNRVTGFAPDAWQRKMLDTVDRANSALIVAPTSAGKTFVSYYCMEKILRTSDHEIVVFVSPEKALMNQVCGSVYARFKTKVMTKGKSQFGTLHPDYNMNALNCQILVTVAECLEHLLLSTDPEVQEFVSRIRYVIFDEVHSIGVSDDSHMWEHLFLLIRCPFLALSATVGNVSKFYEWLLNLEKKKTNGKRKVDLIQYMERYSELELSIINIEDPTYRKKTETDETTAATPSKPTDDLELIQPFMPYGVFSPEKLKIFGIPDDQQLTSKQILHLYKVLANLDDNIRKTCEPNTFFGQTGNDPVWISRSRLRELENKLKEKFMQWVNKDEKKLNEALGSLRTGTISEQLEYRSGAFSSPDVADKYISRLVDELQTKSMLPAICFNDDGDMCEMFAAEVVDVLEQQEKAYMETAEFKNLDNSITRDDTKLTKSAKRQRDADDKRKKEKKTEEDEDKDRKETVDPLEKQKAMREKALERFKLKGLKNRDQDLCQKAIERLSMGRERESTKLLRSLIERGVAFHHARMTSNEKQAVEILFRAGYLAILFSTRTLALGVNMPCKTVIFGMNTFYLTPLIYRQMSGRAGRRGFDHKGNVIFMGIPTKKMRRLLTASLSNLEGNPPFDTTFILRLLSYVNQKNGKGIQTTIEERNQVALSVLNNYFSLYTRKGANDVLLQRQLKLYFAYSVQFLRHLQLIDENCFPQNLSSLCCILHKFSPGNLLFVHLLQRGVFHRMCAQYKGNSELLKYKLLVLLANLFTRTRMPPTYLPGQRNEIVGERTRCLVHLPNFPADIQKHVDDYDKNAVFLYSKIMEGPDLTLKDPLFDITGISPSLLTIEHLVSPISEYYSHDDSFLPKLSFQNIDYRGRKVYYNAFAVDLYLYQERKMLYRVHQLQYHGMWYNIHDFVQVLRLLSTGLTALAPSNDPFLLVLQNLFEDYNLVFQTVFDMTKRR